MIQGARDDADIRRLQQTNESLAFLENHSTYIFLCWRQRRLLLAYHCVGLSSSRLSKKENHFECSQLLHPVDSPVSKHRAIVASQNFIDHGWNNSCIDFMLQWIRQIAISYWLGSGTMFWLPAGSPFRRLDRTKTSSWSASPALAWRWHPSDLELQRFPGIESTSRDCLLVWGKHFEFGFCNFHSVFSDLPNSHVDLNVLIGLHDLLRGVIRRIHLLSLVLPLKLIGNNFLSASENFQT